MGMCPLSLLGLFFSSLPAISQHIPLFTLHATLTVTDILKEPKTIIDPTMPITHVS